MAALVGVDIQRNVRLLRIYLVILQYILSICLFVEATLRNNLGKVVQTYVPLTPSSRTRYRPTGGDAVRLGR